MKATAIDCIDLIYKYLSNATLSHSGGIYKLQRPVNSDKEDIVINSVNLNSSFLQNGVFNVNCIVPKLEIKVNNLSEHLPDTKRINTLSKELYGLLRYYHSKNGYNMSVEYQNVFQEKKESIINLRIKFNINKI